LALSDGVRPTCPALTAQGIRAKRQLERMRLAALDRGDSLTFDDPLMMRRLADTIDEGLALLTRAGMLQQRVRPASITRTDTHP
jgi:hypothetical protein